MANNKDKKILNVPALRFPEFTEEWKNTTLKNECSINPTSDKLKDEFVYVDLESVEKGELTKKQVIEKENAPSRAQRVLRNGDVLFQCVRPYQRNNYLVKNVSSEVQWVASTGYAQLRTERNNPAFIYHLLNTSSFNKKVIVRCTGSSYPAINSDDLSKIHFYICGDIEEQKRIADFLTLLDERIATQNKIIEKYESLIQAMCDTLIGKKTQQVMLSFNDFGESYSGLSGKSAEDFGEGSPFITYMNVHQNQIIDITDIGLVKINKTEQQSLVQYGDILFTLSSETPEEVGMGAVYLGETYPLYLNSFCFGIHITDESKIFPPFLAYYVSSESFRKAVFPLAQGSTRFNLQKGDFMKKVFPFPTIEQQRKIYSILKTYSDKLNIEKLMIKLLCSQKQYLLRQLFI